MQRSSFPRRHQSLPRSSQGIERALCLFLNAYYAPHRSSAGFVSSEGLRMAPLTHKINAPRVAGRFGLGQPVINSEPAPLCLRPIRFSLRPFADRLASCPVHCSAAARIVARSRLRCEGLACGLDRAKTALATCHRHALLDHRRATSQFCVLFDFLQSTCKKCFKWQEPRSKRSASFRAVAKQHCERLNFV